MSPRNCNITTDAHGKITAKNVNIKHNPITLVCEACECKYEIPFVRLGDEKRMRLVLAFAVCPHCETPRNEELDRKYQDEVRCGLCNVPASLQPIFEKGMDQACYKRLYREEKVLQNKPLLAQLR